MYVTVVTAVHKVTVVHEYDIREVLLRSKIRAHVKFEEELYFIKSSSFKGTSLEVILEGNDCNIKRCSCSQTLGMFIPDECMCFLLLLDSYSGLFPVFH